MSTLIANKKIDEVIQQAIRNDSLPENSFVIVDSNIPETKSHLEIMSEISQIAQKMHWVKDYNQYYVRKFEYPFAYKATPLPAGIKVLDAGCSIDPFAPFLSGKGLMVHGIDNFSSHDVPWDPEIGLFEGKFTGWQKVQVYAEHLKKELDISVNYHNEDMASTDFENQYLDRIFCISVLEHLPEFKVKFVFDEWRRILAKDGLVVVTVDYVTQGTQNFNIGKVLEDAKFALQGQVNVFGTHKLPLGDPESGFPHIIAAFVARPISGYEMTWDSKIYRQNSVVRFTIDQIHKRMSQVKRKITQNF